MKISSIIAIACLLSISVEETMAIRIGSVKPDELKSKSEKTAKKEGDDDVKGDDRTELEAKKKDLKAEISEKKNPSMTTEQ